MRYETREVCTICKHSSIWYSWTLDRVKVCCILNIIQTKSIQYGGPYCDLHRKINVFSEKLFQSTEALSQLTLTSVATLRASNARAQRDAAGAFYLFFSFFYLFVSV